jgi:hypothetical protein
MHDRIFRALEILDSRGKGTTPNLISISGRTPQAANGEITSL